MTFLSVTGLVFLGFLALAALYLLGWLILLGVNRYTMVRLERAGVVYHHWEKGWLSKAPVDYTKYGLGPHTYRPSKQEVTYMIEGALAEAAAPKKGKK